MHPAVAFAGDNLPFPGSLPEFQKLFPDDAACAAYLEAIRWPQGFICGWCGEPGEPYRLATRPHALTCRKCLRQNRLPAGTVMEKTHTPLSTWFWGAYLVATYTPGMSAIQFQKPELKTELGNLQIDFKIQVFLLETLFVARFLAGSDAARRIQGFEQELVAEMSRYRPDEPISP